MSKKNIRNIIILMSIGGLIGLISSVALITLSHIGILAIVMSCIMVLLQQLSYTYYEIKNDNTIS